MHVGLSPRNLEDLQQRVASWPPEQREATVREVLLLVGKLAPRGIRRLAGVVLRIQISAVSKPASNWGGVERGKGRVGQTSDETWAEEDTGTNVGVNVGRGVVKMVCG